MLFGMYLMRERMFFCQSVLGLLAVAPSDISFVFLQADLAVVGSRGMGGIHRKIASLIGLGSVSDHLVCLIPNCLVH